MANSVNFHLLDLHKESKSSVTKLNINSRARENPTNLGGGQRPTIPHPKLFEALSHSPSEVPKVADCAVHLELLEVFHTLRVIVLNCQSLDKTFGITPRTKKVYRQEYSYRKRKHFKKAVIIKDATFHTRRREKWDYFLEIAVGRFLEWIDVVDQWMKSWTVLVNPQLPACLLPPLGELPLYLDQE